MIKKPFHTFLWGAVFFTLLFLSQLSQAESRDPYAFFFNDTFGDLSEELKLAQEEGKKGIFLFFEMDECPFCHYMKTKILNQSEVQEYFRQHFRMITIDIEGDIELTDFSGNSTTQKEFSSKQFRVRATPVMAFINLQGQVVHRYTGKTSNPQEFLWMGEYVVDTHYEKMKFTRFKRQKRKSL